MHVLFSIRSNRWDNHFYMDRFFVVYVPSTNVYSYMIVYPGHTWLFPHRWAVSQVLSRTLIESLIIWRLMIYFTICFWWCILLVRINISWNHTCQHMTLLHWLVHIWLFTLLIYYLLPSVPTQILIYHADYHLVLVHVCCLSNGWLWSQIPCWYCVTKHRLVPQLKCYKQLLKAPVANAMYTMVPI